MEDGRYRLKGIGCFLIITSVFFNLLLIMAFSWYTDGMQEKNSKLVYSTDRGGSLKGKDLPVETPRETAPALALQRVTVRLDRKARGGKSVSVIEGLRMSGKDQENLLKGLKSRLGTGGTARDSGAIEIQGDHRDAIMAVLEKMGFRPKRSGG